MTNKLPEGVQTKTCYCCKASKTLDAFCKHRKNKDGLAGVCRTCDAMRKRQWRKNNPELHRAKQKAWRDNNREAFNAQRRSVRSPEEHRKRIKEYEKRNPEKIKAHKTLQNHVYLGKITKPKSCSVCKQEKKPIVGHHWDYSKPLNVIWCCQYCHVNVIHKNDYLASAEFLDLIKGEK